MSAARPALRLLTLNVNGLRESSNRRNVFRMLVDGRWDVVVLQETHQLNAKEGGAWASEGGGETHAWAGRSEWNHGTNRSKGVAVLFRDGLALQDVTRAGEDAEGRLLRVDFTFAGAAFSIVAVYAPVQGSSQPTQSSFFRDQLLPLLPSGRHLLVGGDFNCVAGPEDVVGPPGGFARFQGYLDGLADVEAASELFDAWRLLHPDTVAFTHTATARTSSARLDRWLISETLRPGMLRAEVEYGFPGDHLGVSVQVTLNDGVERGPGVWSFPLALLDDTSFVDYLIDSMTEFLTSNPITATYSRIQRWEALKIYIREVTEQEAFILAKRRRAQERNLRRLAEMGAAEHAARPGHLPTLLRWQTAHQALKTFHEERSKVVALRAGVVWELFGEQPTRWFHHLVRERGRDTLLHSLLVPTEEAPVSLSTTTGRLRAGDALCDFFSGDSPNGLFRASSPDLVSQNILLAAIPFTLPPSLVAEAEGPPGAGGTLPLGELAASLACAERNKRPGSDGLPYEFYSKFWNVLGPELFEVASAAFASGDALPLPPCMRTGLLALIHKGNGQPRNDPDNYRPITLLNTDYKIIARALTTRLAGPLNAVISPTQTAFLPDRWIGDNVLAHLEEVEYLLDTEQPGCIVFLDFSKAYDRIDRGWLSRCLVALGLGPHARRWVDVLLLGTQGHVLYNGWRSPSFPIAAGLGQGSPLSPLLYTIAAHPLACHLEQQQRLGVLRCIPSPSPTPPPVCHMHADDTTIHVEDLASAARAITGSVDAFCRASNARLQLRKSQGLLFGPGPTFSGLDPLTGITFSGPEAPVRHLGVLLGHDAALCARTLHTMLSGRVQRKLGKWSSRQLSFLGRAYVAKQCLASSLYYHATFVPVPSDILAYTVRLVMSYVASPSPASGERGRAARLFPRREVCAMEWAEGGIRLVDIELMIQALQAKIIARLLDPARHVWKLYMRARLSRAAQVKPPRGPIATVPWGAGLATVLTTLPPKVMTVGPRMDSYVRAFRALLPNRITQPNIMDFHQVMCEPLFYNLQIRSSDNGRPLGGAPWRASAAAGVCRVRDLRSLMLGSRDSALPPVPLACVDALTAALPASWRSLLTAPCPPAPWRHDSASGRTFFFDASNPALPPTASYSTLPSGQLLPDSIPLAPPPGARLDPCRVVAWEPRRRGEVEPGEEEGERPARRLDPIPGTTLYFDGLWAAVEVASELWGLGKVPITEFLVRAAAERLRTLRMLRQDRAYSPGHARRPAIWSSPAGQGQPAGVASDGLAALDARAADAVLHPPAPPADNPSPADAGPGPSRRPRPPTFEPAYDASWMRPSRPRDHPLSRAQRPRPPPPEPARARSVVYDDDTVDLGAARPSPKPPWQGVYTRLVEASLSRPHRAMAWRLLHGVLLTRAHRVLRGLQPDPAAGCCTLPCCVGVPETLTHLFFSCPLARVVLGWVCQVWFAVTGSVPPLSAGLFLADDQRAWRPPPAAAYLWTHLRLAVLAALWNAAARRSLHGRATPAAGVAAAVMAATRQAMFRDWSRVEHGDLEGIGVYTGWMRGRRVRLTAVEFRKRWGFGGVLCRVVPAVGGEGVGTLTVQWTTIFPVPMP